MDQVETITSNNHIIMQTLNNITVLMSIKIQISNTIIINHKTMEEDISINQPYLSLKILSIKNDKQQKYRLDRQLHNRKFQQDLEKQRMKCNLLLLFSNSYLDQKLIPSMTHLLTKKKKRKNSFQSQSPNLPLRESLLMRRMYLELKVISQY